jgi:hypothetical protein
VGFTTNPRKRWQMHVANARRVVNGNAVETMAGLSAWIMALDAVGQRPAMDLVERVERGAERRAERAWIRRLGEEQGQPLFNARGFSSSLPLAPTPAPAAEQPLTDEQLARLERHASLLPIDPLLYRRALSELRAHRERSRS